MFFFDVFPLATKVSIFEIQRFIEFSALKNSLNESFDNVNTVKRDWYRLNIYYLKKAGAIVDDSKSPICEISFRNKMKD
ncbi:UDP-N-acetylglucosamine pyrophosphorylase [Entamoeba histolytica HM-3:IMSS]|uniref:UDP-N-acetylglucosamine pyrophosphorylase n=1 Tax=Entamoeba histolytica HM-3:IMSS TaxID=885315 RepID=M7W4L0_ENTHI|nr:UDP-N-acetylglucosamine pyrophosphorylase [Entamoeba histolytica HM-3:IMSS]